MTLTTLFLPLCIAMCFSGYAAPPGDSTEFYAQQYLQFTDSVNKALVYQTGNIKLDSGKISLNIPSGFKYLGRDQSVYVLTELWGNPSETASDVLGMIFPQKSDPFVDSSYAFVISYSEIGYVKDDDAGDINYDELLTNLREGEKEENDGRVKAGYRPIHLVGWAQKPFYDKQRKILHWAKELKFSDGEDGNTLNYEVRILGRKGMLSLNAVGQMTELPIVNNDIAKILNIATFNEGHGYGDFDPDIDEVAAWTIGGLVAGKLLAKVGLFAVALKFLAPLWKFIAVAFIPIGAWVKKRIGRKKDEYAAVPAQRRDGGARD